MVPLSKTQPDLPHRYRPEKMSEQTCVRFMVPYLDDDDHMIPSLLHLFYGHRFS